MALKLLSPLEAQAKNKKSLDSEKYRLVEVQTLITQKYKELSQAERDFDDALQRQRNIWGAEELEHTNKVAELEKKVEDLEERKKQALIPLTFEAEKLDTKASALVVREEIVSQKEADVEEMKKLLQTKLDEVSERELQATKFAQILSIREDGIKRQAEDVKFGSERLTKAVSSASHDIAEKERDYEVRKAQLGAKELRLAERERAVEEKTRDFDRREMAILDKRKTLERVVKELKQKYGSKFIERPTESADSGGTI